MLNELIHKNHSCKKSNSNGSGVCPVFREIAHIYFDRRVLALQLYDFDFFSENYKLFLPSIETHAFRDEKMKGLSVAKPAFN